MSINGQHDLNDKICSDNTQTFLLFDDMTFWVHRPISITQILQVQVLKNYYTTESKQQRYLQTNSLKVRVSLNFFNITNSHTNLHNNQLNVSSVL